MAATVTGAFVVLDRASRPIRKIRNEALQADAAVTKLGHSLDKIGTREQIQMMGNTTNQIKQLAGESHGAAQEVEQLGKDVDRVATPQRTRNINTQAGAISNTGRAARDADRPVSQLTRGVRKLGDESERGRGRLARFGSSVLGLRQALMVGLIPVIGLATQGISALGGGLIALLPRLGQLAGLAAPAATAVAGIGLAAITAKLAFSDLGKAMGGNAKALKNLTPEAKSFMNTLKQYQPVIKELRASAQRGLFPGLEVAIRRLNKAVPMARQLLQGMGGRLGALGAEAAGRFTNNGFLRDLQMIGDQGMHVVTQLGRGFINMASGIRHILVAGLPFTNWLADTVLQFTHTFEQQQKVNRETGVLAQRFDHARSAITVLGHVARNLFQFLGGVMKAATGTGNELWDSIDRVTRRWADWSQSARGQHDMRKYFHDLREPLHEIVGFVGDLGKALGGMATGSGFAAAMRSLRAALPALGTGLNTLANTLGPAMFQMLGQVLTLASTLVGGAGGQGPLMIMLSSLNGILSVVNGLIQHIPGLGAVFAGAFTILALRRFADGVGNLAQKWLKVAGAARAATAAEREATAVGMGAGGPVVGGRPTAGAPVVSPARGGAPTTVDPMSAYRNNISGVVRNVEEGQSPHYLDAFRQNMVAGAEASQGVGFLRRRMPGRLARGLTRAGGFARGLPGMAGGMLARGGAGVLSRLGPAAGGLAEFMAPVAVLSGIGGAMQPVSRGGGAGAAQRAIGFGDAASFGLAGGIRKRLGIGNNDWNTSAAEFEKRSYGGVGKTIGHNLAKLGGSDPSLEQASKQIKYLQAERANYVSDTSKTGRALYRQLGTTLSSARRMLAQQADESGRTLAIGFGQAFNVYSHRVGIHKAMDLTTSDVTHKMRAMGPQGARALGQNMIEWAREQARANPKLWGEVRHMESEVKKSIDRTGRHIKVVNGQILDGSSSQWKSIGAAMTSPVEQAKAKMSTQFTAIQREAMSALVLMGYDKGTAQQVVSGMEKGSISPSMAASKTGSGQPSLQSDANLVASHGGNGLAQGGRLPGLGLSDTVKLAHGGYGAPGELVVNRHTEADVNRDLMMAGRPPLGARVARESRPHYMATGDRIPHAQGVANATKNQAVRGLQGGISGLVQQVLAQFPGLSITSTTGGGHAKNSYHYRGLAADIGGSPALMDRAAAWVGSTMGGSLLEGIHNPNLSIKNGHRVPSSFWGPTVWGEHANHIHLAANGGPMMGLAGFGSATGGGPPAKIHLSRYRAGKGVPSMLMAGGANAYARGMEGLVNSVLAKSAGGGGGPATKGVMSFNQVAKLAESVGLPGIAFAQIAKGESGFNPSAVGHDPGGTQGLGLWQITTKYNDDIIKRFGGRNAMFNAHTNALAAKAIYDRAGIGAWYGTKYLTDPTAHYTGNATGGRIPGFGGWYGAGGRLHAKRPQYIGVGDGMNPETVDVTPIRHTAGAGSSNTGGKHVTINVHPGAIVIHGADAGAGREAADAFMGRLADLVNGMGMESEADIS